VLGTTQSLFVGRLSEPINTGCGENVMRFNIIAGCTCDTVGLETIRTLISLCLELTNGDGIIILVAFRLVRNLATPSLSLLHMVTATF
jgi:hypothetical protein